MAVPEHHIRESIARYLSEEMSLLNFQTWFAPRAWEILETGTPAAELASQVDLLLAEFTSGHLSEEELQEALTPYGSVAMLHQASVDVAWEIVTSAQSVSLRLHDIPRTEPGWIKVTKEVQAA